MSDFKFMGKFFFVKLIAFCFHIIASTIILVGAIFYGYMNYFFRGSGNTYSEFIVFIENVFLDGWVDVYSLTLTLGVIFSYLVSKIRYNLINCLWEIIGLSIGFFYCVSLMFFLNLIFYYPYFFEVGIRIYISFGVLAVSTTYCYLMSSISLGDIKRILEKRTLASA